MHLDLKPENMMYFSSSNMESTDDRTLKPIDFDTSLLLSVEVEGVEVEVQVGTLRYASPEIELANRCNDMQNPNAPIDRVVVINNIYTLLGRRFYRPPVSVMLTDSPE
jgi:serine/threonine protein kinase